ncbi:MAG: hypothetical protein SGI72_14535 [Planctomycetota bacterium]|nr:hypothetical protein [Planctomycetota bacterium]
MHSTRNTILLLTSVWLAALTVAASIPARAQSAQDATPAAPRLARMSFARDRVLYDESDDARTWAVGTRYKASFGSEGAVFIPAFGSQAPRNYPHALSPDRVTVDGEALAFESRTSAARDENRVSFERGAFVERYDLALESLEQSFVFESLPRAGELVIRIPIASELAASEGEHGLEFANDFGTLTYSRAIAIDALGRRFTAPTRLVDGSIEIAVSAADIAVATFPLIVDPVVGTLYANLALDDTRNTDSAYDVAHDLWLLTWTNAFSATDTDVFARGWQVGGVIDIVLDSTQDSWNVPRCAYLAASSGFLVVASVTFPGAQLIRGKRVLLFSGVLLQGVAFDISGGDIGAKTNPDVGGDSDPNGSTNFCVVWERAEGTQHGMASIATRLVSSNAIPQGSNATYLTIITAGSANSPTVSKSSNGSNWLVTFIYDAGINPDNVWAARVGVSGGVLSSAFPVTSSFNLSTQPVASSFLNNSSRAMIAYRRRATQTGQGDIWVALLDGSTVLSNTNLTALENSGFQAQNQIDPGIDCDGQHFVVAYSEFDPTFSLYNVHATDIALSGNALVLVQKHVPVRLRGLSEFRTQVAAARDVGTANSRDFCISWDFRENDQDYDLDFELFEARAGGSNSTYCFGNGTGGTCPCGSTSTATGCGNSSGQGATLQVSLPLSWSGPSSLDGNASLLANGVPNGTMCLFFQGTTQSAGTPLGDGLLCVTGAITRLGVKSAPSGSAVLPSAGDAGLHILSGVPIDGGARTYQVWYRDSVNFCTSATFNLTNGLLLNWAR